MSELNDLSAKYQKILKDVGAAKELKTRLEERKKTAQKQLSGLVDKIKAQGYDPKNLKDVRDKKVKELSDLVAKAEKEVVEVFEKLKSIDIETSI